MAFEIVLGRHFGALFPELPVSRHGFTILLTPIFSVENCFKIVSKILISLTFVEIFFESFSTKKIFDEKNRCHFNFIRPEPKRWAHLGSFRFPSHNQFKFRSFIFCNRNSLQKQYFAIVSATVPIPILGMILFASVFEPWFEPSDRHKRSCVDATKRRKTGAVRRRPSKSQIRNFKRDFKAGKFDLELYYTGRVTTVQPLL